MYRYIGRHAVWLTMTQYTGYIAEDSMKMVYSRYTHEKEGLLRLYIQVLF